MSFLDRFKRADVDLDAVLRRMALSDDGIDIGPTASGITVTPSKAMQHVTVFACIRILAETIGSLPCPIYRTEGRGRVKDRGDWRWRLLNGGSSMQLFEHLIGSANMRGRGYAYIWQRTPPQRRSGQYDIVPLPHPSVQRVKTPSGEDAYRVTIDGEQQLVDPSYIIDVPAYGGLSPITVARQAIASALAADEYAARLWANDARPGGIIEWDHQLDDKEFKRFKRRWDAGHRGLEKSHLIGVLPTGAKWHDVGMSPEDSQFLETRKFSVNEMARLFRVPPYLVADLQPGSVSYASVELQSTDFVIHSLRPWLVRLEQELEAKLFAPPEDLDAGRYPQFNVGGLLRGDQKTRFQSYAIAIQWGWMSRADVRELEDLPEVDGLDEFLTPLNMQPHGLLEIGPR